MGCRCWCDPRPYSYLAAAIGCGLWFGKNWVLTGNPTYPLLYEVFDGKTWTAEKQQQWNRVHRPHDFSAETLGKDLGRVVLTSEWLSPLIVPLAALALSGWHSGGADDLSARGRRRICPPLSLGPACLRRLRHRRMVAVYASYRSFLDSRVAGRGTIGRHGRLLDFGASVAHSASGAAGGRPRANFLVASMGQGNAWFVGLARLRHDPAWIDPWHEYFNTHLTAGRLLSVGDAAVFDLTVPVLYNTCFDDCIFEQLVRGKTAAEVRAELAAGRSPAST